MMCQIIEETESSEQLLEENFIDENPGTDSVFKLNLVKIEHQDVVCQIKEEPASNDSNGPLIETVWLEGKPTTDSLLNLDLVKSEHQVIILILFHIIHRDP
ncbi:hypothetical protein C0J52_03108 [Blattella germanica]|nr:hypothetical protein C0J52_03108 [Blattella germanica]